MWKKLFCLLVLACSALEVRGGIVGGGCGPVESDEDPAAAATAAAAADAILTCELEATVAPWRLTGASLQHKSQPGDYCYPERGVPLCERLIMTKLEGARGSATCFGIVRAYVEPWYSQASWPAEVIAQQLPDLLAAELRAGQSLEQAVRTACACINPLLQGIAEEKEWKYIPAASLVLVVMYDGELVLAHVGGLMGFIAQGENLFSNAPRLHVLGSSTERNRVVEAGFCSIAEHEGLAAGAIDLRTVDDAALGRRYWANTRAFGNLKRKTRKDEGGYPAGYGPWSPVHDVCIAEPTVERFALDPNCAAQILLATNRLGAWPQEQPGGIPRPADFLRRAGEIFTSGGTTVASMDQALTDALLEARRPANGERGIPGDISMMLIYLQPCEP